jgi:membrane-bound serine protease (ClpP class)
MFVLFFGGASLTNTRAFKRMTSTETQQKDLGYTANFIEEPVIGKTGVAQTVLRPSGKVMIEGKVYDAFSRGEFIDRGEKIEVIAIESSTLRVKKIA